MYLRLAGSQPISEALRKVVASMDLVIRTDALAGFQAGDPMAIWVLQLGRESSRNISEVLPPDLTAIKQVQCAFCPAHVANVILVQHDADVQNVACYYFRVMCAKAPLQVRRRIGMAP